MSISARVDKARELLSTALQQVDSSLFPHIISTDLTHTSTVSFSEHKQQHHSDLLVRRKCYYKQIKASKMLSRLAYDPSFRDATAMNQQIPVGELGVKCDRKVDDCNIDECITTVHIVACDSLDRMDEEIVASTVDLDQPEEPVTSTIDFSELPTIEPPTCEQLPDDQTYLNVTEDFAGDIVMNHQSIKRLKMRGFYAIKELIARNKSVLHNVELRDPENRKTTNAAYCYDDTPIEGWRKEISVRMSGKSQGSLDIHYIAKSTKRRFRSQNEIARYLSQNNLPLIDINRFEFRSVFCVCHSTEDPSRSFLECSFGRTGCNRWMHPECVGLGFRTEHELKLLPRVACPFCSAYLTDTGELSKLSFNQQPIM
jgi:hypothetical protein